MTTGSTSRWRPGGSSGARGAADRVRLSHAQTRTTVRLALVFLAAAAVAAGWGGSRWLALHLLLAGAVVLAISGVSLMLTVTWAAAPAPPNGWVIAQRSCVAAGAAGIAVGRTADWPVAIVGGAGLLSIAGLVLLAVLLVVTVRRGVNRRFDVAVAAYVAALVAGIGGMTIGASMAVTAPTPSLRAAHVTTNLLGLVGLVVGGTLPFFAATVVRARMNPLVSPTRLALTLCWQIVVLAVAVAALASDNGSLAAVGLGGYVVGIVAVLVWMPRPTRRQLRWAGPRLVALWAGGAWWAVAVAATAVDAAADRAVFEGRWLSVLVIAGYVQILWGSLAYLLPMLRGGGPERLGQGFASTRSWPALVAVNVAGAAMACSWTSVAAVAITVWALDSAWRAVRVGTAHVARPIEE